MKFDSYLTLYTEVNSKYIVDARMKVISIKLLQDNIREHFSQP